MRLLIAVGGGGHFSPALAVIDQFPKDWEILLVGRKYAFEGDDALSLEFTTAKRLGLPFVPLTTGRLQRKLSGKSVVSLLKIPVGGAQAVSILRNFKPDVVLSFGGYVSVPVVAAAAMLRIPVVIHEQTLHAGLANKVAAKFAEKVCISWEESRPFFPAHKIVLTGNPIRTSFRENLAKLKDIQPAKTPTLYITGGSGGAHGINVLIEGCLEKLLEHYYVIHQTGDSSEFKDFDRLEKLKASLPENVKKRYLLKKFIAPEDVFNIMASADLVIARSGVNTVTELLFLGKPCLLIPLPYGQQNEQQTNALFVQKVGLGKMAEQAYTTSEGLYGLINEMMSHIQDYKNHGEMSRQLVQQGAAENIINVVKDVYKKKS